MHCLICGGDHEPSLANCDDEGMVRQAKKIGIEKWNRITRVASNKSLKEALEQMRKDGMIS